MGAFLELQAKVDGVLLEGDDALVERVDVGGCAEARLAPGLLSERLGQSLFQVLDAGCEPDCSFVCGEQVGLQRRPTDNWPDSVVSCVRDRVAFLGLDQTTLWGVWLTRK